jgi:hypothetical protein
MTPTPQTWLVMPELVHLSVLLTPPGILLDSTQYSTVREVASLAGDLDLFFFAMENRAPSCANADDNEVPFVYAMTIQVSVVIPFHSCSAMARLSEEDPTIRFTDLAGRATQ